ncbi:hypothetical protein B0I35DRAFT_199209 [Stachybotrys elegans]|uniref:HNH nuclease domain-containing protein n=1 Tax=Stachybotrys elegans TaxID=80388 RepID=A0A8K0SRK4_9HYPO|nr:hypothetical protein B0I35DRAFT_199209 [Stachybotrys elegans]
MMSNLAYIWGEHRINRYLAQLGERKIDMLPNMISLNCLIHKMFDDIKVGLGPVESKCTPNILVLRYRTLQDSKLRPTKSMKRKKSEHAVELDADPRPLLTPFVDQFDPEADLNAIHWRTGTKIQDGYELTMETDNPHQRPLPSIELLNLRNDLVRMIPLAGGAGPDGREEDDDDDNDISVLSREVPAPSSPRTLIQGTEGMGGTPLIRRADPARCAIMSLLTPELWESPG